MNIKKEVYEKCKNILERELQSLNYEKLRNKIEIKRLAEKQRILKSQIGILYKLRNSLKT